MTVCLCVFDGVMDDPEIANISDGIDNISSQMYSIEFDVGNGSEDMELLDIETEVVELQDDFWEG